MVYTEISRNKRKTALFITFFLALIIGLGWFFSYYINEPLVLPLAVGVSVAMSLVSYYYSDKIVLKMAKASEIKKSDDPELYNVVENLAIAAGLPTPKVY